MLRLRLAGGVDFSEYAARWDHDARAVYADELSRFGKVGLLDVDGARFALSERGLAVADAVASEFLRVRSSGAQV